MMTGMPASFPVSRTDLYAEAIRAYVPMLVPGGKSGVVLHMGSAMGLLPLLSIESKEWRCRSHWAATAATSRSLSRSRAPKASARTCPPAPPVRGCARVRR